MKCVRSDPAICIQAGNEELQQISCAHSSGFEFTLTIVNRFLLNGVWGLGVNEVQQRDNAVRSSECRREITIKKRYIRTDYYSGDCSVKFHWKCWSTAVRTMS